jgi:hypothetical protein
MRLLAVKCASCGPRGQESLAQGLPWVFGLSPEVLKGRSLTRHPTNTSRDSAAPSGLLTLEPFPRANPGLSSQGPLGEDSTDIEASGKCRTAQYEKSES